MKPHTMPETEFVVRHFVENDCEVTTVVIDPADAQQTLYGTVTHHGRLVGSYYCVDIMRQRGWRIVTADGEHLSLDGVELCPPSEGDAVIVLTTILTGHNQREIDQRLRAATRKNIEDADVLGPVADEFLRRANMILAEAPTRTALSPYVRDAVSALLATTYRYDGERRITTDDMTWANTRGGRLHVIEHADGSVTFTKAHRDECPFITSSGTHECDDECDVEDPADTRRLLGR